MTYREHVSMICNEMFISGHAGLEHLTAKMMVFFFFTSSTNVFAVAYVSWSPRIRNLLIDKGRHIVHTNTHTSLCGHMKGVPRKLVGYRN